MKKERLKEALRLITPSFYVANTDPLIQANVWNWNKAFIANPDLALQSHSFSRTNTLVPPSHMPQTPFRSFSVSQLLTRMVRGVVVKAASRIP